MHIAAPTLERSAPLLAPLENDELKKAPSLVVADDWLIWQLADSALPTGGFAHSGGLEAAWQHREVRGAGELKEFIQTNLVQVKRGMLPFMISAHRDPTQLQELDQTCDAFLTNHVANRASRLQGKALLASARRIFVAVQFEIQTEPAFGHLAPISGIVFRALGVDQTRAAKLFVFWHLRGWLAAAVRLGVVGPLEAQAIQFNLGAFAEDLQQNESCGSSPVQTAPLLDIWQGAQDRLYSRLFQS